MNLSRWASVALVAIFAWFVGSLAALALTGSTVPLEALCWVLLIAIPGMIVGVIAYAAWTN